MANIFGLFIGNKIVYLFIYLVSIIDMYISCNGNWNCFLENLLWNIFKIDESITRGNVTD